MSAEQTYELLLRLITLATVLASILAKIPWSKVHRRAQRSASRKTA